MSDEQSVKKHIEREVQEYLKIVEDENRESNSTFHSYNITLSGASKSFIGKHINNNEGVSNEN